MEILKYITTRVLNCGLILCLMLLIVVQQYIISSLNDDYHNNDYHNNARIKHVDKVVNHNKQVIFKQENSIENISYSNDASWVQSLVPQTGGFIWVKHNESFSLEFGISMFHALHCLQFLRSISQEVVFGTSHPHESGHSKVVGSVPHALHAPHCIGYLAQYITCAADSTIEPPYLKKDASGHIISKGVDGHNISHSCRDTTLLWDVAQASEHQSVDPWGWQEGDTVEKVFGG